MKEYVLEYNVRKKKKSHIGIPNIRSQIQKNYLSYKLIPHIIIGKHCAIHIIFQVLIPIFIQTSFVKTQDPTRDR